MLCSRWDLIPQSGMERVSPALQGGFSTPGPPGKSPQDLLNQSLISDSQFCGEPGQVEACEDVSTVLGALSSRPRAAPRTLPGPLACESGRGPVCTVVWSEWWTRAHCCVPGAGRCLSLGCVSGCPSVGGSVLAVAPPGQKCAAAAGGEACESVPVCRHTGRCLGALSSN